MQHLESIDNKVILSNPYSPPITINEHGSFALYQSIVSTNDTTNHSNVESSNSTTGVDHETEDGKETEEDHIEVRRCGKIKYQLVLIDSMPDCFYRCSYEIF